MRIVETCEMYRKLAEPVAGPNNLGSVLQLSNEAGVTDDKARRFLSELAADLNDCMIVTQNRPMTLTEAGRQFLEIAIKIGTIAKGREVPPTVLTIEVAPVVFGWLALALPGFLNLFASLIQLRICPLNADLVRKNIQNKATSFGVGVAECHDTVPSAETLGPKTPWVMVMPKNHRLAGVAGPVTAESFSLNDRLFIPEMGLDWPGMDVVLKAIPLFNRIVCDGTLAVRMAMSGLGAAVVPELLTERDFAFTREIQGVEPMQARFFLPRNRKGGLTEPEEMLIEQIRKVAKEWKKQGSAPEESAGDVVVEAVLIEEPNRQIEGVVL